MHMMVPAQHRTPGNVLRSEFLAPMGIQVADLAAELGLSRDLIDGVIAGAVRVNDEIAACLGDFLGTGSDYWMRLQRAADRGLISA